MTDTILEKDTLTVTVGDDHSFVCSVVTLGRTGENAVSQLEINIPEELNNFWAYLDFKKASGKTFKTPRLAIDNNKIEYDIPGGLLDESGNIEVQLVLESENGEVWKSATKKFVVLKSIDAGDDIPEAESFISEAQKILDETVEITNAFIAEAKEENEAFKEEIEKTTDNLIAESNKKIDEALELRDGYASAITETASGEVVSLNDVSPMEHELKVNCNGYAISNMSRTIQTEINGEITSAEPSEVFTIHDNFLFGSWLESLVGGFGEETFNVELYRFGLFAVDEFMVVTIGGKRWDSSEATNAYLKENCGFTFDYTDYNNTVTLNISRVVGYAISNVSRTSYSYFEGEGIDTDAREVFTIHDNFLFGSWLETIAGDFDEETVMFRITRITVATPNCIYVDVFKNDEWKGCWGNYDESDTGYDEEGIYGTNSYLKEKFGFTFDEDINVNYEKDCIYLSISNVSPIKLIKIGKNAIPYPFNCTSRTVNGVTFTNNGDGTITADGTATDSVQYFLVDDWTGHYSGDYVISGYEKNTKYWIAAEFRLQSGGGSVGGMSTHADRNHHLYCEDYQALPYILITAGTTLNNVIFKPQLEVGTIETEYEKPIEPIPYSINANGTVEGVTSIYPTTTLYTDTEGVVLDVEYNVDTKKYVDNQINKKLAEVLALVLEV